MLFRPYGYGMYFDPTYILVLAGAILCMLASAKVRTTYSKFSRVQSMSGYTGATAAQQILRQAGIYDVRVQHVSGNLTDHYDPRNKTLNLSDSVYGSNSVAAIGVAAHECGHAIQHARNYLPLKLRSAIVPAVNLGTNLGWILILLGLFITSSSANLLLTIGVLAFSLGVVFQLITLPVEFNASSRALTILKESGILRNDENYGARKVLSAAALTYVAGAVAGILQLLRVLIIIGGRRRDN